MRPKKRPKKRPGHPGTRPAHPGMHFGMLFILLNRPPGLRNSPATQQCAIMLLCQIRLQMPGGEGRGGEVKTPV